jgi:hypothetical protein
MVESDGNQDFDFIELTLKECTDEDYEEFYPPVKS